jgi:DNA topoisomerase-2
LRAGSNFNDEDDQSLIGTNGVGSCLTNILSTKFIVETADGSNHFKQEFSNGMRDKTEPKVKNSLKSFTEISFIPDYEYFGTSLTHDNKLKIIKRVIDSAGCNPGIKFYLNGEKIQLNSFKDYISLYSEEIEYDENDDWKIGITHSKDGFDQISFVNSVETYSGGTHVDYIASQVVSELREFFKKKHKVDVKPSEIKQHMRLFISANVNRPKFSSQTKENMISEPKDYKTSFSVSKKFIIKLTKSEIIKSVLDWVEAKQAAQEKAELRALNKTANKQNPNRVPKFVDATEKHERHKCMLFLTEGDSASKAIISAKTDATAKFIGSYPLKGKPLNVCDVAVKDLMGKESKNGDKKNSVFENLMIIMGLTLGEEVKTVEQLRFGKLVIMSDQDLDGFHINGLLINMIYRFWPELFTLGVVYRFKTPVIRVTLKDKAKTNINFYTENDFNTWRTANPDTKCSFKYLKGLASNTSEMFKEYLQDMNTHLVPYTIEDQEDHDIIDLAFSKDKGASDKRKEWLDLT